MAEKRVSVRLSATGGNAVRRDLEGVGVAGKKGMGQVSAEAERASQRLEAFARRAGVALAATGAALAAAGVAAVRSGLANIDSQAKLAASLGTTVESIQVLSRAGDLAGVSFGQVEAATRALTVRLSQAATGAGPAVKALEALGLSATTLIALPLDQRLEVINAALDANVEASERAAVRAKLFGDEAALAFSRIDTGVLRTATQDVRDFGVVVSQSDAAQIERTNDAISRLGLIWTGVSNQLAVAAAPALEAVADALADVARGVPAVVDALEAVGVIAAGLAATRIPALIGTLATLTGGANLAAAAMGTLRVALALLGGPVGVALGLATAAAGAFLLMRDRSDGLDDSLALVKETQGKLNDVMRTFFETAAPSSAREAVRYASDLRQQAAAARDAAASELALARARVETVRSRMEAGGALQFPAGARDSIMQAQIDNVARAEAGLARAEQALVEAGLAAERAVRGVTGTMSEAMTEAVEALRIGVEVIIPPSSGAGGRGAVAGAVNAAVGDLPRDTFEPLNKGLGEMAERTDAVKESMELLRTSGQRAFEGLVSGQMKASEAAKNLLADFARLASNKAFEAIFNVVAGAVIGGIGGGTAGGFNPRGIYHSGGLVGAGGPTRMVHDGVFAGAPRYHSGGIAGLRPNEVPAILERGERVLSRREVRAGAGGAPVNISIDARGAGPREVDAIRAEMRDLQRSLPQVIAGQIGRPGAAADRALSARGNGRRALA
jgi:hypothetical protein